MREWLDILTYAMIIIPAGIIIIAGIKMIIEIILKKSSLDKIFSAVLAQKEEKFKKSQKRRNQ